MDYYKKYQSQEWVDIQNELSNEFIDNNNLKVKPVKLTKKQLTNGTKFKTRFSENTVYTINVLNKYVTTDILFNTVKNTAVKSNQYSLESITDKYLKIWDIQFGEKRIFKVKLSDIEIVSVEYNII